MTRLLNNIAKAQKSSLHTVPCTAALLAPATTAGAPVLRPHNPSHFYTATSESRRPPVGTCCSCRTWLSQACICWVIVLGISHAGWYHPTQLGVLMHCYCGEVTVGQH
eukprot:GHUV01052968.1.p1 GENE.GHUV01052968.1~~GHUV01052968.1.p1  ORF type:complete len:115 (-),score=5.79 GHUV01052968.1:190-513(-)